MKKRSRVWQRLKEFIFRVFRLSRVPAQNKISDEPIGIVPDNETTYRLARYKMWLDQEQRNRFTPLAFELMPTRENVQKTGRTKEDIKIEEIEKALSVYLDSLCKIHGKGIEGIPFNSFGIAKLIVGAIRNIGNNDLAQLDIVLDVEPDPPPDAHAGITGIPHWSICESKAERIADLLAQSFERIV